jgi:putative flippase GtrA
MERARNRVNNSQKGRFLAVGGTATLIDFGLLFAGQFFGVAVILANILSTGLAFSFSFFANKHYTFKTNGANVLREMALFSITTLFGLWVLQSLVIGFVMPLLGSFDERLALLLAKIAATTVTTIWNYVMYSRVVFTHKKDEDGIPPPLQ